MSQIPTIERTDVVRSISDDRLDELLGEPYKRDDPNRVAKMAERLSWACALGAGQANARVTATATRRRGWLIVRLRRAVVRNCIGWLHRGWGSQLPRPARPQQDVTWTFRARLPRASGSESPV